MVGAWLAETVTVNDVLADLAGLPGVPVSVTVIVITAEPDCPAAG